MSAAIETKVRFNQRLKQVDRELARTLSAGIYEVAAFLIPLMQRRFATGRSSQGYFRALGEDSVPKPGPGLFWVSPKRPQPDGWVGKVESGDNAGWVGYRTYREYCALLGSPPRRFRASGIMMASMHPRVDGPRKVSIAFSGTRKTTTGRGKTATVRNRDIAYINSREEPVAMMTPTRDEVRIAMRHFDAEVQASLEGISRDAEQVTALRKRAEGLQKRVAAAVSRR